MLSHFFFKWVNKTCIWGHLVCENTSSLNYKTATSYGEGQFNLDVKPIFTKAIPFVLEQK